MNAMYFSLYIQFASELHTNVPQMIVANKKDLNCKKAFNPMMDYKMEYIETVLCYVYKHVCE